MSDWDLWSGNEARVSHDHAQTPLPMVFSFYPDLSKDGYNTSCTGGGGEGGTNCYHIHWSWSHTKKQPQCKSLFLRIIMHVTIRSGDETVYSPGFSFLLKAQF